ncbi:MAG TPA: 2-dehydro-3-deoxygalactonokinase [Kofleriaceae bacterium]|nr:2-dehydro-3-deoxygalactonokinase [Kofleriaceae bacterium]
MSIVLDTHLIGLDWGTTQLRAYRFIADGEVAESRELPAGIQRIGPEGFERALDDACGDWRAASPASPLLACGMIGSAQGWREAPYIDVPTSLDALGHVLTDVATASGATLHIVPGLIVRAALPEVLRGEETQIAGALDIAFSTTLEGPRSDRWIGLPGTHTKWVRVCDGNIVQFHTFMTGEVFAALCDHTILGRTMRRPPAAADPAGGHAAVDQVVADRAALERAAFDQEAFDRGLDVARSPGARTGVLSSIFSTRTLGLVGALAPEAQADYLSGLLIGHELAGVAALGAMDGDDSPILLVGTDPLCRRYQRALAAFGRASTIAANATERGLWRVARSAGLVPEAVLR